MKLLIVMTLLSSYQAIAKKNDYRILNIQKEYQMMPQKINEDDIFNTNPADLSANFGVGAQCGQLNFQSSLKAAINKIKSQLSGKEILTSLALASPLLIACQFSSSLCTAMQNTQQSLNFLMKFNLDQCAIIDKFTSDKAQTYNQGIADCVGDQKAKGLDPFEAHDECVTTLSGKLASITGDKNYVSTVNVLKDSLKWMGVEDEKIEKEAIELVGETTINHGVIKTIYGKGGKSTTPFQKETIIKVEIVKSLCNQLSNVKAFRGKGIVHFIRNIKIEYSILDYFSKTTLRNLMTISSPDRESYCYEMAQLVAKKVITNKTKRIYSILSQALTNPNLKKMERQILELKVNKLEAYLKIQSYSQENNSSLISKNINEEAIYISKSIFRNEKESFNNSKNQEHINKNLNNECKYSVECNNVYK